jgi:hypothetical protein
VNGCSGSEAVGLLSAISSHSVLRFNSSSSNVLLALVLLIPLTLERALRAALTAIELRSFNLYERKNVPTQLFEERVGRRENSEMTFTS